MRVNVDTFQFFLSFFRQRLIKRLPFNLPRVEFMNRERERARERTNDLIHFYGTFLRFSLLLIAELSRTDGRTDCEVERTNTARSISFSAELSLWLLREVGIRNTLIFSNHEEREGFQGFSTTWNLEMLRFYLNPQKPPEIQGLDS